MILLLDLKISSMEAEEGVIVTFNHDGHGIRVGKVPSSATNSRDRWISRT